MSIAVSVVVRPSRLLRLALLAYGAAHAACAAAVAGAQGGVMRAPAPLAGACLLAAALAWRRALRPEMTLQIDVSGLGEIRLTVQHKLGTTPADGAPLRLLPGSTLWPRLLLLLLSADDGRRQAVVLVLPGSVAPAQFRALSVALRVIARRDNKFFGKNKIV